MKDDILYMPIKPLKNILIDSFVDRIDYSKILTPVNFLFVDNYIQNINAFKSVFQKYGMNNNIFYSCKANKGYSFMHYAAHEGCGIEVSSFFELRDALKYTKKIIASGPAKSKEYIFLALKNKVIIAVDDIEELKTIKSCDIEGDIFIRFSDFFSESRFGITKKQFGYCMEILKHSKLSLLGFSFHLNNYSLDMRINQIHEILHIVKNNKLNIKYIDIGGGIPVNYCDYQAFEKFLKKNSTDMYFRGKKFTDFYPYANDVSDSDALSYVISKVKTYLGKIEIIIEPGRALLSNCGISIYQIVYLKKTANGNNIIITNGNVNCLSEQWFGTDYLIEPKLVKLNSQATKQEIFACIAGNLCLEQDMLTWRKIKFNYIPQKGDYLIYYNTAGYQMDSNESCFHKLPLVPKYIVKLKNGEFIYKRDEEYDNKKYD